LWDEFNDGFMRIDKMVNERVRIVEFFATRQTFVNTFVELVERSLNKKNKFKHGEL
jgi:hypothetical protein